jgi:hypothetical protein
MTPKPTALAAAVAAALGTVAAAPASALTVTTAAQTFTVSGNVTDPEGGGATTTTLTGSVPIAEFDAATGVLMGATINLTSNRTETVTVTAVGSGSSSATKTASGSGSSSATVSASGVSNTFATITQSGTCSGTKAAGCSATSTDASNSTGGAFVVSGGALDSYVGSATELASLSAPISATQGTGQFPGAESTKYALTWDGSISATYEYLLHADPSFDASSKVMTLNLDFGTLYLGADAAEKTFSISNPAGERVGLDLDSFTPTGDSGAFTTNLALFSGLAAGGSESFWFDFVTSTLGAFSASYALNFSDADVGAASSRFSFTGYRINLTGNVIARPVAGTAPVPAPGVLGLLGGGLLALGLARRRRSG